MVAYTYAFTFRKAKSCHKIHNKRTLLLYRERERNEDKERVEEKERVWRKENKRECGGSISI